MKYLPFLFLPLLLSCNLNQKAKETVNKAGETVAKAGSEFADGISKGVKKTFRNEIQLSDKLRGQGLTYGKMEVRSSDSATDNILSLYLVFNNSFDKKITVRLLDEAGAEYGRITQRVTGIAGEAHFVDFVFDKRTDIDSKGQIIIE